MAYTLISTQTLLNPTATVTFSAIPQGFKDLVLEQSGTAVTGTGIQIRLNNDAGSNYSVTILSGDGTSATSTRENNQTSMRMTWNASAQTTDPGARYANILSYANANVNKTLVIRSNRAGSGTEAICGLWRSTAAVVSVTVLGRDYDFAAGSTFKLWGVS